MKFLGAIVLMVCLAKAAVLLTVPCLLAAVWLKYRFSGMTEDRWNQYFKAMNNRGFGLRLALLYAVSLCLVTAGSYFIFKFFHYQNPAALSLLTFLFSIFRTAVRFKKHREEFWERMQRLQNL